MKLSEVLIIIYFEEGDHKTYIQIRSPVYAVDNKGINF